MTIYMHTYTHIIHVIHTLSLLFSELCSLHIEPALSLRALIGVQQISKRHCGVFWRQQQYRVSGGFGAEFLGEKTMGKTQL